MPEHKTHFAGKTILYWEPGHPIPDPATTIPRISATDVYGKNETSGKENFRQFLADPASRACSGLAFGIQEAAFDEDYSLAPLFELLVQHSAHFQHLTTLFLGDISQEEREISWINQGDVAPLFRAYPQLEHFGIRGCASYYNGTALRLGTPHSEQLKTLVIETGSMDRSVVHDVLRSSLPALQHLELWTGSANYEANCTVEDFAPLFAGDLFPSLRHLGLRDSEFTDDLAIALSQSSLLERLHTLDLSLGTLSDTGAAALLNCPAAHKLAKLDLHHHYCSEEMMQLLQALPIEVDVSWREEPEDWGDGEVHRFVAVDE